MVSAFDDLDGHFYHMGRVAANRLADTCLTALRTERFFSKDWSRRSEAIVTRMTQELDQWLGRFAVLIKDVHFSFVLVRSRGSQFASTLLKDVSRFGLFP